MNILIIEDEHINANRLIRMLNEIDKSYQVVGHTVSVSDSIAYLQKKTAPDVILADIKLNDGLSFEVFTQVNIPSPVIFTTAYDEYAIQAFKYNSIDYLLKPIIKEELEAALIKVKHIQPSIHPLDDTRFYRHMIDFMSGKQLYRERFLIPEADGYKILRTDKINHITTEDKVTRAYLDNGKWVVLPQNLEELTTELNPNTFFRVNRKFIVHIDSIHRIVNYFNFRVKLKLNTYPDKEIVVSREKTTPLKEWLNR